MNIDLKKEQQSSLTRKCCKYSLAAKLFFLSMDWIRRKSAMLTLVVHGASVVWLGGVEPNQGD